MLIKLLQKFLLSFSGGNEKETVFFALLWSFIALRGANLTIFGPRPPFISPNYTCFDFGDTIIYLFQGRSQKFVMGGCVLGGLGAEPPVARGQ